MYGQYNYRYGGEQFVHCREVVHSSECQLFGDSTVCIDSCMISLMLRTNNRGGSTPLPVSHVLLYILKLFNRLLLLLLVSCYDHRPLDGVLGGRERQGGGDKNGSCSLKPSVDNDRKADKKVLPNCSK